eukprot:15351000-Ditylum_brightwellii.AAC.2
MGTRNTRILTLEGEKNNSMEIVRYAPGIHTWIIFLSLLDKNTPSPGVLPNIDLKTNHSLSENDKGGNELNWELPDLSETGKVPRSIAHIVQSNK